MQIEIPDDVAESLENYWGDDLARQVLESVLLEAYRQRLIGEGQIQRWLGLGTRPEAHRFLKEHGVPNNYTLEDLERDRQTLDRLGL